MRGDPRCTAPSAAAPTPGCSTRRVAEDGSAIRRRRTCPSCGKRFTTVEQMQLTVVKRSGTSEPFTREKAIAGVRKACKGRPVSEDDLARLGQTVEDALRGEGWAEVPAHEIGLAILGPLRVLDEVAYLRFASVYKAFSSRGGLRDRDRPAQGRARPAPTSARDHRPGLTTIRPVRSGEATRGATSTTRHQQHRSSTSNTDEAPPTRHHHTGEKVGHMTETVSGRATRKKGGLTIERVFSTEGVHPYDELTWERRDVVQTNWKSGETVFEQRGVEFPDFWSVNASTIVTTKYFRGAVGTDAREWSLKQLIDRVVKTYRKGGRGPRLLRHARPTPRSSSTSSPGCWCTSTSRSTPRSGSTSVRRAPQQVSACFILSVDDSMDSILNWYKEEGFIFKGGSGAGLNLSRIRSSKELLVQRRHGQRPGLASCAAPTPRPAPSSPAAPPGARPRWSSSTSTTPTSRSSSQTKARGGEQDPRPARRRASTWTSAARDITSRAVPERQQLGPRHRRVHARGRGRRRRFGLRARGTGEVIETVDARDAVPQDQPGRVGVRRPGPAVRRHHQRLAHQPRDRPDHRVQPVLGVHVAGQLLVQPGLAEPAEVPARRRHLRRRPCSPRPSS